MDAIIFTAGIGENSSFVRDMICHEMAFLGIKMNPTKNNQETQRIRSIENVSSTVKVLIIPTNEEIEIAKQSFELVQFLKK